MFVLWKNWRYQKDISKLIDLYCALWGLKRCNPGERKGSIPLSLVDRPLKRLTGATWYVGPSLHYFSIFWIFFDPPIHYITIIKWVWHTQSFCWRYIGMVPINTRISAKTFFRGSKDQSPWVKVLDFSWLLVLKPKNSKFVLNFKVMKSNSGKHYCFDKD